MWARCSLDLLAQHQRPWVHQSQQDIDHGIDQHDDHAEIQYDALDDGIVQIEDGVHHALSQAGPGEDILDDDGAAEQAGEDQAADGERSSQHVRQQMPHEDQIRGQPFAARGADIVLGQGR